MSAHCCEICKCWTNKIGFSDCGMICEECFQKEVLSNAFNAGLDQSIKIVQKYVDENPVISSALREIESLKKETHKKVEHANKR